MVRRIRRKDLDQNFYKAMLAIALPIALQNLIASSINMLDTLMITSLGEASLAAVGLANQVFFFYSVTVFGIATGSSVFIAQFWGKRDRENIKRVLGVSLTVGLILGIIFTVAAIAFPENIMRILSKDKEVIELGARYLRPVSLSYIVTAIAFIYGVSSRAIGQAKMPMLVSIISFITNAFFNYALIFGKFGFPELGIEGAAIGTVIARVVELGIILYVIYSSRLENPLAANFKELSDWNPNFLKKYLKTTSPVILNEGLWALGNVLYSIAYAKAGVVAAAAVQILTTVQNIFMVMTRGVANACTIMVGNQIGAGDEEKAKIYARKFLIISVSLGLLLGFLLYVSPNYILRLFGDMTEELHQTSSKLIKVLGIFFVVKVFNGTTVVGILRGGGDTKFSAYLEILAVWLVGVPMAYLGVLVFKLPVHLVFASVFMEEVVTSIIGFNRVKSGKWVKNIIDDIE